MAWKKTPQGYVVLTATITRAGPVEYYGHEVGMTGADANRKVTIHRTLDELSRQETLKSFEGLPFTVTHPDDGEVNANDHKEKSAGHIQNVRISGEEVVCDVYITDAPAIRALEKTGVREVSVGYEPAEIEKRGGELYQINIRGNHVAVVAEGRYGPACRLNDKRGTTMFRTLKDVASFLKGKQAKLKDAEGTPLTEEELIGMIAALEASLADFQGAGDEETATRVAEVTAQLAELKAQLESMKAGAPVDADPDSGAPQGDDKDARIAELEAENEQLRTENQALKEELEKLKADGETSSTLNDAKIRFPKLKFNDAKSARDVRTTVLLSTGAFNDAQVKAMSDNEVRAAYAAAQVAAKPRSNIGAYLLTDTKPAPAKSVSKRLGGKK